ncbi:MAG: sortase [Actinomycetota bacterium]|nr:sortase [Actinomycetota bacterium]
MGNRSQMRKFKRRRRRAGFVLLMSLAIVVLSVALLLRTEPYKTMSGAQLAERVAVPMIAEAPRAVAERAAEDSRSDAAEGEDNKREAKKQQVTAEKPVAPVPETNDLWMTIPALGLYDNYVANSDAHSALDYGAAKRVSTKFPWQEDANTYISAHRLGWPGTASDHQFYNLPLLEYGDKVYLYDANGTVYTYEVTETFEVAPSETWVTNQVAGRDMISLQTCIENYGDYWTMGPNWYVRYVVRADRVAVTPA